MLFWGESLTWQMVGGCVNSAALSLVIMSYTVPGTPLRNSLSSWGFIGYPILACPLLIPPPIHTLIFPGCFLITKS